jgi:hypothetical protein
MRTDDIVTGREVLSPIFPLSQLLCNLKPLAAYQLSQSLLRLVVLSIQPRIKLILLPLVVRLVLQPLEDLDIRLAVVTAGDRSLYTHLLRAARPLKLLMSLSVMLGARS